jgi:hypothetical protein
MNKLKVFWSKKNKGVTPGRKNPLKSTNTSLYKIDVYASLSLKL